MKRDSIKKNRNVYTSKMVDTVFWPFSHRKGKYGQSWARKWNCYLTDKKKLRGNFILTELESHRVRQTHKVCIVEERRKRKREDTKRCWKSGSMSEYMEPSKYRLCVYSLHCVQRSVWCIKGVPTPLFTQTVSGKLLILITTNMGQRMTGRRGG